MLRSRTSRGFDVARLSNAVSRPGIDPRIWVSYAVLTSDPYIETIEGQEDIVADVLLLPSQQELTARVGAIYAGFGFGLYCPLYKDDEVLIAAPSGDPDEGLVILQRMWSPAAIPPDQAVRTPEDVTLVVQEGKNLRLMVQGGGNVILAVETGKVYLGAETSTEPAAKGQTLKGYLESIKSKFDSHVHVSAAAGAPTGTPIATFTPPDPPGAPVSFPEVPAALLATTTEVK